MVGPRISAPKLMLNQKLKEICKYFGLQRIIYIGSCKWAENTYNRKALRSDQTKDTQKCFL